MKKVIPEIIIALFIIICFTSAVFGQERVIRGKVTTFDSIPLINASIHVKGTKKVVHSDTLGFFIISCLPKDKLSVTAEGFSKQSVKIEEKTRYVLVNLNLKPGPENRDLAVGYGHVKDENKLASISSLNEDDMNFSQYSNIYDIIRGRFPGIQIRGGEIIIHGSQSIMGNNAALLVVDGIIVEQNVFASLSPIEIASINVLKDSAAAVYGIRGANGVVIVETKRGRKN